MSNSTPPGAKYRVRRHRIDALLLLMTVIRGSNFTVVTVATRSIPEFAFTSLRLLTAAFLVAIAVPEGWPRRALRWTQVPAGAWTALVLSALFVACTLGYTSMQTIGSAHTSMYSNVTPLVAMIVGAIWLGEPLTVRKLLGTAAVIAGLAVTRLEQQTVPPVET